MTIFAPKYSLSDTLDEMLDPGTLSGLLARPVTRVTRVAMNDHAGLANSELSYVDTNAGRFVLKRMSIESDWVMSVTNDVLGRSVKLWQYGLLDQLLPNLEHKIRAAAHDEGGWAILMDDLSGHCFNWDDFPRQYVPIFLDLLARTHAEFWNDPRLQDSQLGLGDAANLMNHYHYAHKQSGDAFGVLPHWIRNGWQALPELLEADVYRQMLDLVENPAPLLDAIRRYPFTLLHGDYRAENLAYNGRPVALDWQQARCSLMTIDLAWFANNGYVQVVMSREKAFNYYRDRLEGYLDLRFDDSQWQAMVALGSAVDALASICFPAFFYLVDENPDSKAWNLNQVIQKSRSVMDVLKWL